MELAQWESVENLQQTKSNNLGYILDYRPVKYASAVFKPKGCFASVKEGEENFDKIYCYGNTLIMILSFVDIVLFSFVMVFHIKAYKRTMKCA